MRSRRCRPHRDRGLCSPPEWRVYSGSGGNPEEWKLHYTVALAISAHVRGEDAVMVGRSTHLEPSYNGRKSHHDAVSCCLLDDSSYR